jgi:N-acyl amino acid synthase of PEP-CTERM/exosortase system
MFDHYFEAFLADTPEGKEINYHIRYQVYCLETGYEEPTRYPGEKEIDSFDEHSVHFMARTKPTVEKPNPEWIAALRLVVRPFDSLPMNAHASVDFSFLSGEIARDIKTGDTSLCAEVSRMCVVSNFRRRRQERSTPYQMPYDPQRDTPPANTSDPTERRKAPWLMLGLLNAARDYSEKHNIRYWFFLTNEALARIIEGVGFSLTSVGPPCEHRGKRIPYFRDLSVGYENIATRLPIVYQMFTQPSGYRLYSELGKEHRMSPLISSSPR